MKNGFFVQLYSFTFLGFGWFITCSQLYGPKAM